MDLFVVWWSFAGTWGLVWGHLMDLVVVWWSFVVTWEEEGEGGRLGSFVGSWIDTSTTPKDDTTSHFGSEKPTRTERA